jgi:hypothetical protein
MPARKSLRANVAVAAATHGLRRRRGTAQTCRRGGAVGYDASPNVTVTSRSKARGSPFNRSG